MNVFILTSFYLLFMSYTNASQSRWSNVSPRLQFRPKPEYEHSSLIWVKSTEKNSTKHFINDLEKFLKPYHQATLPGSNYYQCDWNSKPTRNKTCIFGNFEEFGPCGPEFKYSYSNSSKGPCVFLTFDQFPSNWTPQFYNTTNLPKEMPLELKNYIKEEGKGEHQRVWVSCEGEQPADLENVGPVIYFPERSFRGYLFFNNNAQGYLSPLVAVHFKRPQRGVLINISCTVWAKNIPREPEANLGTVHFELLLD